jgi:hypothetical protein
MTRQLVGIPRRTAVGRPIVRLAANCPLAERPGSGLASPLAPPNRTPATSPVITNSDAAVSASTRRCTALDAMTRSPQVGYGHRSQAIPLPFTVDANERMGGQAVAAAHRRVAPEKKLQMTSAAAGVVASPSGQECRPPL